MTKTKEHSPVYMAMHNMLAQNDPHSFAVLKMIKDIYPAFERKIKDENDFMYKLVMSGYNPMDLLDYPVCDRCEGLAAWNGWTNDRRPRHIAECMNEKCGHTTYNPPLFREWMRQELKKRAPDNVIEAIDYAMDDICSSYIRTAYSKLMCEIALADSIRSPKMGITEQPNQILPEVPQAKADIEVNMGPVDGIDIDEMIKKEEEELENAK